MARKLPARCVTSSYLGIDTSVTRSWGVAPCYSINLDNVYYNTTHLDYAYTTFRGLIAHHLAHGIRDFVLNWVFENPTRLHQFRQSLVDLVPPVLVYRLTCTPEELERRIRQRGFPGVEAEVGRGQDLIRLLDQAAVHGDLGHIVETTHRSAVAVGEAIWQHVQHITSAGSRGFEVRPGSDVGGS